MDGGKKNCKKVVDVNNSALKIYGAGSAFSVK
jgi:hypothetical protein